MNSTTGLSVNLSNTLTDELIKGADANVLSGENYTNHQAFSCSVPNAEIATSIVYPAGLFVGYYDIRVFYTTDTSIDPFTHILTLQVYEDGELIKYSGGNSVDGEIRLDYLDQTQTIGSRIKLWFNPNKTYKFILKTSPSMDGSFNVLVDYIRFEKVKHDAPFMAWINATENTGRDLWMIDTGTDIVTGTGAVTATKTTYCNYKFKTIENAWCRFTGADSLMDSLNGDPGTDTNQIGFKFRNVTGSGFTGNYVFKWTVIGTVELPLIRPL